MDLTNKPLHLNIAANGCAINSAFSFSLFNAKDKTVSHDNCGTSDGFLCFHDLTS